MGSSKKVTVGYKYFVGMHMVLCHGPVDAVTRISVDDKTAWSGVQGQGTITINAEDLFGGLKREGGVSGKVDIMLGGPTQLANEYLESKVEPDMPAFRGVLSAVLQSVYTGLNPYLKKWAFRVQRINTRTNGDAQWYLAKAQIGNDMNPAHIINECLTDSGWGLGYSQSDIDEPSFQYAADTLFTESMGVSLLWDRSKSINDFIQEILNHIQGSLFISRTTGKFVLKLARNDYNADLLTTLDESSINKISNFKRATVNELVNSVTVSYWDSEVGRDGSVSVQDISLISQHGSVISTTMQFPGFTTKANAIRAASTVLNGLSKPLATGTLYANRKGAKLNVGDVFKLNWPRYGVVSLIARITNIELGALNNGQVKIDFIEDAFATSLAVYVAPPTGVWTSPIAAPAPCPFQIIQEASYYEVVQRVGESSVSQLTSTFALPLSAGVRPSSDSVSYELFTDPDGNNVFDQSGTGDFCPTAILAQNISYTTSTFGITSGVDLSLVTLNTYALIDDEIISVLAISDTSITVGRGCIDTVPTLHSLGARIYFVDEFFTTDSIEYAITEVAKHRILPTTGLGTLAVGSASTLSATMVGRFDKPYPPQNIRLNGVSYGLTVSGGDDLVIDWSHRDRKLQTAGLIDYSVGSIGPELGTTYSLWVRTLAGTQIATITGLTGTSHTFTVAQLGANYGTLRLQVQAVRDGVTSFQMHDIQFTRNAI